jgi:hypothetical protein
MLRRTEVVGCGGAELLFYGNENVRESKSGTERQELSGEQLNTKNRSIK